jgi:eukaryotic-like serine/threonine-protein kinase
VTDSARGLPSARDVPHVIGRYELHDRIATGGMAGVYFGRLVGSVGFSRTVAIKRLHAQFAQDPEFVEMFLDEARLAGKIRHPNVIPTLDVVALKDELFLVMDYVHGESLGRLIQTTAKARKHVPIAVVTAIMLNVLEGLHAAHEVTDDSGHPLGIVHRDVSPQNILVGVDGVARVLDFGVAKARGRMHHTKSGMTKGKIAYMAPEQILGERDITKAADIYGASVCMWEGLVAERLFQAETEVALMQRVLSARPRSPREARGTVPEAVAEIVMKGLARDPNARFESAHAMARALAGASRPATAMEVGEWVRSLATDAIAERAKVVSRLERDPEASGANKARAFVDKLSDPAVVARTSMHVDTPGGEARTTSAIVTSSLKRDVTPGAVPSSVRRRTRFPLALAAGAVVALTVAGVVVTKLRGSPAAASAVPSVPPPASSALATPLLAPASAEAPPAPSVAAIASAPSPGPSASAAPRKAVPPRATGTKPAKAQDGLFDRN